jgi:DNA replication and repair protein RecF
MYLKKLSLINFKNYKQVDLNFSEKINCFTGLNGIGKTNLLDAVYYLSFCKSYFNQTDSQNINHTEDFFVIQGEFERNSKIENIYCGFKTGKKKIFKRNDKEYEKLSEHIGLIPVVMISPDDNTLIIGGSEERRKYMDSVISQFDSDYLHRLIKYNRILMQRNKLLKDFSANKSVFNETLDIYDEQLASEGSVIFEKRLDFIKKLLPVFQKYYNRISKGRETVELIFKSQFSESDFLTLLRAVRTKDLMLEYTSVGVHKDDLSLELSGWAIRKIGSQGQQKTYLTALKFAQYEFLRNICNLKPILLLDDIFDKLDSERVTQIINLTSDENFGQIFITDTNRKRIQSALSQMPVKSELFEISDSGIEIVKMKN